MSDDRFIVEDARLRFYLERRQQIDQWVGLRDLEPGALDRFLQHLAPDVDGVARDLGPEVSTVQATVDGESMWILHNSRWQAADGIPVAGAQIGWYAKSSRFVSQSSPPWVGVRCRNDDAHAAVRSRLGELVATTKRGQKEFPLGGPTGRSPWPRYRSMSCDLPDYWEDLGPYATLLLAQLRVAYVTFADLIEQALVETGLVQTP